MTAEDILDGLYFVFNSIKEKQAAKDTSDIPTLFEQILSAAAPNPSANLNSKRLAAQFICRLFASLPSEQQKAAFKALIDLVEEDDDPQTRRQVISGLPKLCRSAAVASAGGGGGAGHTAKVANVLVQLLQTDDEQELLLVQHSLLMVLNANASAAIEGIFGQIERDDVAEIARLRAVRFLADRLLMVDRSQMTTRVEEAIVGHVDRALQDVSEEEFVHFVRILASLQCMQTLGGRQRLVDTICSQAAESDVQFDPSDPACLARVRACAKQVLPFLSRNICAQRFVVYFLDRVLPALDTVPDEVDVGQDRPRLDLLRQFAELSGHAGSRFSPTDSQFAHLLACLNSVLPLPPPSEGDDANPATPVNLNFSEAECLLLALHSVWRGRPDYFADRPAELAQLRQRMQYFLLANQSYQKSLRSAIESQQQPEAAAAPGGSDPNRAARLAALAITASVGRLIRELFKAPPAFLQPPNAMPSWRTGRSTTLGSRRPVPAPPVQETDAASLPRKRRAVDLPSYRPPAGKFSSSLRGGGPRSAAGYGGRSRYYNVYTSAGAQASESGASRKW